MSGSVSLIVTSINRPTAAMHALGQGCRAAGMRLVVVGDTKSPADFALDGGAFLDIASQLGSGLAFARFCPTGHYARKHVGCPVAIRDGARLILETDDDNIPRAAFFGRRERVHRVKVAATSSWINLYRYFSDALIWPRGLPLDWVNGELPGFDALPSAEVDCPIQQGLADANPDVDAIYRLLLPLPQNFRG